MPEYKLSVLFERYSIKRGSHLVATFRHIEAMNIGKFVRLKVGLHVIFREDRFNVSYTI